ncbi:MerR family transcriptional regulator [Catellatospora vulcania]|uniref:MerR family transcriptional regulator n=1 Tax=Catellatospora vulcania TaxID=1460450 RepID=UPI001E369075|nr:MerR family transcriptional regulator [Catellatospora vulcania]
MKISHLSRLSGVSVPTIKFYLREQLLPPGVPTARNQAEYDEAHLARLRLIRLLTGVGDMSLAAVRDVLAAVDGDDVSPAGLAQVVNQALRAEYPVPPGSRTAYADVERRVDGFLAGMGWRLSTGSPERESLVRVLATLEDLGLPGLLEELEPYVEAADRITAAEVDRQQSIDDAATIVARIVLFEVAFSIVRRMAFSHHLAPRADSNRQGASAPLFAPKG